MKFTFVPDFRFNTFDELTPKLLTELGIKGVILDIDNTLEPYEHSLPGEHVKSWLGALREAGICCAFVSNNNRERVELFNGELGLPAFYKASKPFKKNVIKAMKIMGSTKENTILMGDQVFTDVWAARNARIKAALVPPINDKKDIFTKFKRLLEKPVLHKYERIHK
jgi:HAD superfamily phosphatase (TIGR01668 family)